VAIAGNCLLGSAKVGRIKCQIDVGITYTMYTLSHMCQQMVESEAQGFNIGTEGPPSQPKISDIWKGQQVQMLVLSSMT